MDEASKISDDKDGETSNAMNFGLNRRSVLKSVGAAGAIGLISSQGSAQGSSDDDSFELVETSVPDIHAAFVSGATTAQEVVEQYLDRIEEYDDEINALITTNPEAVSRAKQLDAKFEESGLTGTLHGIPVILKDNQDTGDLPTTGGSKALENSTPPDDAYVVQQVRDAGGIVLAKANLHELAAGGTTVSSLEGQTLNPYALNRTPGGSSGGTGASIAANLGTVGFGTDTVNSIRSPASACNLVGLRPTRGLVSRDGTIPSALTHDMVGPITRTVTDAAFVLDTIVGYDPSDPVTARSDGEIPDTYTDYLNETGLQDAQLGVLRSVFGDSEPVLDVANTAVADMEELGATTIELDESIDINELIDSFYVGSETQIQINEYFDSIGPDAPVDSLEEFVATGQYDPSIEEGLKSDLEVEDPTDNPEYFEMLYRRSEFIDRLYTIMADNELDALVFPHQKQLVAEVGEPQLGRNGFLASGTGFSSMAVPAGFSPDGVPVGMEFFCRPFDEPLLFKLAYSYEQGTQGRHPPEGFGSIDD
jgi:Asp-tRNA(Asn)/Glu-tRNA(Gln) amidotransferase A subunit family amidase